MSNLNLILLGLAGLYLYEKSKTVPVSTPSALTTGANTPTTPITTQQPPVIPVNGGGGYVDNTGGGGIINDIANSIGNIFDWITQPSQPTYGQQYPVPPSVIQAPSDSGSHETGNTSIGGGSYPDYLPNFDWGSNQVTLPDNFYYPDDNIVDSPITYMPAGGYDVRDYYQAGNNTA